MKIKIIIKGPLISTRPQKETLAPASIQIGRESVPCLAPCDSPERSYAPGQRLGCVSLPSTRWFSRELAWKALFARLLRRSIATRTQEGTWRTVFERVGPALPGSGVEGRELEDQTTSPGFLLSASTTWNVTKREKLGTFSVGTCMLKF